MGAVFGSCCQRANFDSHVDGSVAYAVRQWVDGTVAMLFARAIPNARTASITCECNARW